jgi:hypothetical protein
MLNLQEVSAGFIEEPYPPEGRQRDSLELDVVPGGVGGIWALNHHSDRLCVLTSRKLVSDP